MSPKNLANINTSIICEHFNNLNEWAVLWSSGSFSTGRQTQTTMRRPTRRSNVLGGSTPTAFYSQTSQTRTYPSINSPAITDHVCGPKQSEYRERGASIGGNGTQMHGNKTMEQEQAVNIRTIQPTLALVGGWQTIRRKDS